MEKPYWQERKILYRPEIKGRMKDEMVGLLRMTIFFKIKKDFSSAGFKKQCYPGKG
jgi:hypothetical protein